ncbi:MAG TPA: SDR family oxidoreductase [Nocardioides sp.]|jgi:nucleoside-diphosphate-sugar epimerase|uniref:SDR family oxidoreductase n=1 Tax=Nocardioides sp. TaxID=35761 RepID=UPI002E37ABA7|nr:SDR family oxidoreductase [Nocardioides sp.]HEX3930137.1 SDR family oxidoreductase [Nocardioides sp.]
MRVFVTGASGWIGSAVVAELLAAEHEVVGLARSEASAATVAGLGAEALRGDLTDLDSLRAGARRADGVVHLGYHHDFSQMAEAAAMDRAAIDVLGEVLAGTGGPLVTASGTLGLSPGRVGTERDVPDPANHPRIANAAATLAYADRGVRASVVRFAPTVHGAGDHGFIATLVAVARDRGISAYVDEGANRWPAVHRLDAADLVRRVVDDAPAGSTFHAVAEVGISARTIAEAIGLGLGVPVSSIPADRADEHFGWIGRFFGADAPASNALTRERLGWDPNRPGLVADLDAGHYFLA